MNKALEKGYKLLKIFEVWHFENSSIELFKEYVKKFMKIKLETSPYFYKTDDEVTRKQKEIEYRDKALKLGIILGDLQDNPGLRFIAKLCLNSLWGKFGQKMKRKKTLQ